MLCVSFQRAVFAVKSMCESRTPQRVNLLNRIANRFFVAKGWTTVPADGSAPLLAYVQQEDVLRGMTALYEDTAHPYNLDNTLAVATDRLLYSLCPSL